VRSRCVGNVAQAPAFRAPSATDASGAPVASTGPTGATPHTIGAAHAGKVPVVGHRFLFDFGEANRDVMHFVALDKLEATVVEGRSNQGIARTLVVPP
jgi:hypothetical protein